MDIKREVTAGCTVEGSATITIKPNDKKGIEIEYSDVSGLKGEYIRNRRFDVERFVKDACAKYGVNDAYFIVEDYVSYNHVIKKIIDDALQEAIAQF